MADAVLRRRYRVEIEAAPRAKQRPFHTKAGRTFTRKETVNAEAWIRLKVTQTVGTPLVSGPVAVRILYVMAVPKSMPLRLRNDAVAGRLRPTGKPDLDNLSKLTCDALSGIAWKDDAIIASMSLAKIYGDRPRTILEWWTMAADECETEDLVVILARRTQTPESLM